MVDRESASYCGDSAFNSSSILSFSRWELLIVQRVQRNC